MRPIWASHEAHIGIATNLKLFPCNFGMLCNCDCLKRLTTCEHWHQASCDVVRVSLQKILLEHNYFIQAFQSVSSILCLCPLFVNVNTQNNKSSRRGTTLRRAFQGPVGVCMSCNACGLVLEGALHILPI
jgi:hypothetical protein